MRRLSGLAPVERLSEMARQEPVFELDLQHAIAGEIGIGFFKRLSRGVKKIGRTVVKPVAKVARAAIHSPYVQAGLSGVAMVFPVAAPLAAGVIAADKLLTMAEKGAADVKKAARDMIGNTKKLAAAGNPGAARAMRGIKAVFDRRRQVAAMSPAARAQYNAQAAESEREKAALLAAARKHAKALRLGGHLITKDGRILRGTFVKE